MGQVLLPHSEYAATFLEDIVIHFECWDSHLCRLQAVLDALKEVSLTANPRKFRLGYKEVEYLRYRIGHGPVKPQEKNFATL